LADLDEESARAEDGFPLPEYQRPQEISSDHMLNRHGSSPLLEGYLTTTNGSSNEDYFSYVSRPQARGAESSSTLRSYYDRYRQPLQVSQQTSASSARDMALRKGVSSPFRQDQVDIAKPIESQKQHDRNASGETKFSAGSKKSANTKFVGVPRRRPSLNDPPTLFPHSPRAFHAVSPPPALVGSSIPKPRASEGFTETYAGRSTWWQRNKANSTSLEHVKDSSDQRHIYKDFSSVKVNVRKPKAGAKDWFDSLNEDDERLGYPQQLENSTYSQTADPAVPLSIHEIMSQEFRPTSLLTQGKSSFCSKSNNTPPSDRKLSFRLDASPPRQRYGYSPPPYVRSTPTSPSSKSLRSTQSNRGIHDGMNLHVESVLSLSSSEDEDHSVVPAECSYRSHRSCGSIDRADYGSEVSLGIAQRLLPPMPRPIVTKQSRRSSKRLACSEPIPPVPQLPNGPHLSQRTSSLQWREVIEAHSTTTDAGESMVESAESSLNGKSTASNTPASRNRKGKNLRGSKLMKVTSEEERLLEAMREKRASIRQNDYHNGFNKAMQLQQDCNHRPQTAAVDGRNSRSSIHGSRNSSSPPRKGHEYKSSLGGSRRSASTDNLTLDDVSYPFPHVVDGQKVIFSFASSPKPSPSPSFSPSDILPSTPSTRNSPMTPPLGHSNPGVLDRSPSRAVITPKSPGHDRKRTISGSVVMLDGVEQHAQQLDEENDITGWAMDSY